MWWLADLMILANVNIAHWNPRREWLLWLKRWDQSVSCNEKMKVSSNIFSVWSGSILFRGDFARLAGLTMGHLRHGTRVAGVEWLPKGLEHCVTFYMSFGNVICCRRSRPPEFRDLSSLVMETLVAGDQSSAAIVAAVCVQLKAERTWFQIFDCSFVAVQ